MQWVKEKPFFTTIQFVMAGSTGEGLRYATIETPEKYYQYFDVKTRGLNDAAKARLKCVYCKNLSN